MSKQRIAVAVDGPAGAGKSSISKAVAKQLGYLYIDTGPCIGPLRGLF